MPAAPQPACQTQASDLVAALRALDPALVADGPNGPELSSHARALLSSITPPGSSVTNGTTDTATDMGGPAGFGLHWRGKAASLAEASPHAGSARLDRLPLAPLGIDLEANDGRSSEIALSPHMLIAGDNLHGLRALRETMAGQVKFIYIDPPYNTGKAFVYDDNFKSGLSAYRGTRRAGRATPEEQAGRRHTQWLSMMTPRVAIAHDLLAENGLMAVSISDAEVHTLRMLMDQIFGSDNFIANIVWHSTRSVTNTALVSVNHTHTLLYARSRDWFRNNRTALRLPEDGSGFTNPDDDPRGPWKADPFQVGGERPNQLYPVVNPNTGITYRPNPGCSWKNEKAVFDQLMADGRIVFGATGEAGPQRKRFLSEALGRGRVTTSLWSDAGTTTSASRHLKALMGAVVFETPKPVEFMERLIELCTTGSGDELVLDFFAGSGTTGEALLRINARDGGRRRLVLIQERLVLEPSEKTQARAATWCAEAGIEQTLFALMAARISRARGAMAAGGATPDPRSIQGFVCTPDLSE